MNNTHRTPSSDCPSCGTPLDAASGLQDNAAPNPGDVTVCAKCGEILAFDNALALAPAPAERLDQLDPEQVIQLHAVQTVVRNRSTDPKKGKPGMTDIVKLDDEQTLAWIREYYANRERMVEELKAYQAEVEAKVEAQRAEAQALHKAFWKRMEEIAPATVDGDWKVDLQYIDQGLVFVKRKEEKPDDGDKSIPAPIRALMDALGERLGGTVGVAKIKLERDPKRDDDKDE